MIRLLFEEIVIPLFLIFVVRALFKSMFTGFRNYTASSAPGPQASPRQPPPVSSGGELKKDPVCGTYVSATASVKRSVDGQLIHFCSEQCRDKYKVA
jgi:YHS domain-containing protein